MNITVLANHDIASNLALNLLLPRLSAHNVTAYLSSRVGKGGTRPQALEALSAFERALLRGIEELEDLERGLVLAQPRLMSFGSLGRVIGRPIETLDHINSAAGQVIFAATQPDLVITIRYGVILKQPVIAVPSKGVINLHSGPLPDYRGVMASFWGLLNGAKALGTTLHYIDDNMIDTGRIISTTILPVNRERSYLWHVLSLYTDGCENIVRAVNQIQEGRSITSRPQASDGRYYTFPSDDDIDRFFQQGLKLFDEDARSVLSRS